MKYQIIKIISHPLTFLFVGISLLITNISLFWGLWFITCFILGFFVSILLPEDFVETLAWDENASNNLFVNLVIFVIAFFIVIFITNYL